MAEKNMESIPLLYGDAKITFIKFEKVQMEEINPPALHSHGYYELHFSEQTNQIVSFVSNETKINKNEFLIIAPNTEHYTLPYKTNTLVVSFVLEKVEGKKGFYDYFSKTLETSSKKSIKASPRLFELFLELNTSKSGEFIKNYCRMKSVTTEIVEKLFYDINLFKNDNAEVTYEEINNNGNDIMLERLIDDTSYSIKDIARTLGYSVRHTSRLIRKKYNMTLMQFRRYRSLSTAKKLIKTKKLSIEEVAFLSGFKNVNALRSAFAAEENTTPTKYKKENIKA